MSVIATAVKHLIAAGVSGDDLVRAIAEMESQMQPAEPELTKRQARNKRYYEGLKASEKRLNKTIKTVSDVGAPSSSPCPLVPPSQTLPPIIPQTPSPTPETKRAKRLPADWVLPASWGQWAINEGLSEARVRLEADKFRDYWVGKGGKDATKTDWLATWRNWIRNSGGSSPSRGPPEPRMTAHQQRTAAAKAEIEKFLNPEKRHDPEPPGHTATLDLEPGDFRFERPVGFGTR